jgi:hypothetical protein
MLSVGVRGIEPRVSASRTQRDTDSLHPGRSHKSKSKSQPFDFAQGSTRDRMQESDSHFSFFCAKIQPKFRMPM